jgi:hypothetical protein
VSREPAPTFRLTVLAEADPGVLTRILHPFVGRNIVPLRVSAERDAESGLTVSLELSGLDRATIERIALALTSCASVLDSRVS